MDRREALKLLTALPMVKSIEVAQVAPTDVIVVEAEDRLSDKSKEYIRTALSQVWPNRKIVVTDGGIKIRIAREA